MREKERNKPKQREVTDLSTLSALEPPRTSKDTTTSASSRPRLNDETVLELIQVADAAKRLKRYSLSNLLFAYLADSFKTELHGKLFLERRGVKDAYSFEDPRYRDLFSLKVAPQRGYLCIPYPLVTPSVAQHFDTIALPAQHIDHARKFPWATFQEQQDQYELLKNSFFKHFSDEVEQNRLVEAARRILAEPSDAIGALHRLCVSFFGKLPDARRSDIKLKRFNVPRRQATRWSDDRFEP